MTLCLQKARKIILQEAHLNVKYYLNSVSNQINTLLYYKDTIFYDSFIINGYFFNKKDHNHDICSPIAISG